MKAVSLSCLGISMWLVCLTATAHDMDEAPRIKALLEQGAWFEKSGGWNDRRLSTDLYCEAAAMGSGEAYFRIGKLLANTKQRLASARQMMTIAAQLGHLKASEWLETSESMTVPQTPRLIKNVASSAEPCNSDSKDQWNTFSFDGRAHMDNYLASMPAERQVVVRMIRRLAPQYDVDEHLGLAIASVESNFNRWAVSPKNAMGIMQLIPETAARFNVTKPFDVEQNIRGGLAYLRWLQIAMEGNIEWVVAAYNAGENAVLRHKGIPPYRETKAYVNRVLHYAGIPREWEIKKVKKIQ